MSEVIEINCKTTLRVEPDKVLGNAVGKLEDVIVIGINKDGSTYYATSYNDDRDMLWEAERFKKTVIDRFEERNRE